MYKIDVDTRFLPRADFDDIVTYYFDKLSEAEEFHDHLTNLYELDVDIETIEPTTYDQAIQDFVEVFGPSSE